MSVKIVGGDFVCKDDPFRVIREKEDYSFHYLDIVSGKQLRATLRAGPYAFPGGYPLYFIADDGEPLSFQAVRDNLYQCIHSIHNGINDGWRIIGCEVNWEDPDMVCAHEGTKIESAFGDE